MHHHTENESSLFSCLVLSSFVFSSLSVPVFFLCLCLCLCLRVLLRVGVRGLCGVCVCVCFVWCVCVCFVWCGVWRDLARGKNPPCVDSKRPRVYRHHAHMLKHMCAWCRNTRGRFERTHGDVLLMNQQTLHFLSTVYRLASPCARMVLGCSTSTVLMTCYTGSELGTVRLPRAVRSHSRLLSINSSLLTRVAWRVSLCSVAVACDCPQTVRQLLVQRIVVLVAAGFWLS